VSHFYLKLAVRLPLKHNKGVYEIKRCLAEYVVNPIRYSVSERIRSYLGTLEIDGIKVEIMGGIQKHLDNQGWEEPLKVEHYKRWTEVG